MQRRLLLPATTAPADEPLRRRHAPSPVLNDYSVFRDCIRWDFGFTCAICLLHELDICQYGAEGLGVTHIEHIVPRSVDSSLTGIYSNLLYICRLCNGARGDADQLDEQGRRLLDPTTHAWAHHFEVEEDKLIPRNGDGDAEYTEDVYNINDARKVKLRRQRRLRITDFEASLGDWSSLSIASERAMLGANTIALARDALMRLGRWALLPWVPDDAPASCRCKRARARCLPPAYQRQAIGMDLP